jgi:hypothetical protein
VWTGDDGWVVRVQPEGELGSLDYSAQGQYVVFTSNSQYGRPHHVTSYHADLGWRDLTRRGLGSTGGSAVAAISDAGDVVVLSGAGFEDEPGYWFGGGLSIETYDSATRRWTQRLTRHYPDGGIDPSGIDLARGRVFATLVESRSTGRLNGLAARVVLLSGRPDEPRSWASDWNRQVLSSSAAITRAGVGVAAWQAVEEGRTATAWFATWADGRKRPFVHVQPGRTTLTEAAESGRAMDLSVSASGRGAVAYVKHRRGVDHSTVAAVVFRVGRDGAVRRRLDATWQQPIEATIDLTASASTISITLGRMLGPFFPAPLTQYGVHP